MHRTKMNLWKIAILILICAVLCLFVWFSGRNRIAGTVHGADMERIIVDNISYVISSTVVYSGADKGEYIGKGVRPNGKVVLDLYKLKGDIESSYLYARFGWEGQMYQREDLINE